MSDVTYETKFEEEEGSKKRFDRTDTDRIERVEETVKETKKIYEEDVKKLDIWWSSKRQTFDDMDTKRTEMRKQYSKTNEDKIRLIFGDEAAVSFAKEREKKEKEDKKEESLT